jgi:beta-phosphoglucomutase-like phosphatase (HAD superfamily)
MTSKSNNILVIDLDGTLLKTDSLWELFFKTIFQGNIIAIIWLLFRRSSLKNRLANVADLDLDLLPWNQDVII